MEQAVKSYLIYGRMYRIHRLEFYYRVWHVGVSVNINNTSD